MSTARIKQQAYQAQVHYPELVPVEKRAFRRQVKSRYKKQVSWTHNLLVLSVNAALVFGLVQCVRSLVSDTFNLSTLMQSQASVAQYHTQTSHEKQVLTDKIKNYSSPAGIEELARNYLNMVGKNELPVRFQ